MPLNRHTDLFMTSQAALSSHRISCALLDLVYLFHGPHLGMHLGHLGLEPSLNSENKAKE
jgi:hypothetical protein